MDERRTNIDSTYFLVSAEYCCVCLWDRQWTDWPSKHYNAGQSHGAKRCFNAGTPSTTLAQHLVSVAVLLLSQVHFPANTRCWTNVVLMSGRRRVNIQTTFTWIIVSCLQGWCSLIQVMCLIQICTHRGRHMHTAYVHGDSTVHQLRFVLLRSRAMRDVT